jgi:hypothetical protein
VLRRTQSTWGSKRVKINRAKSGLGGAVYSLFKVIRFSVQPLFVKVEGFNHF